MRLGQRKICFNLLHKPRNLKYLSGLEISFILTIFAVFHGILIMRECLTRKINNVCFYAMIMSVKLCVYTILCSGCTRNLGTGCKSWRQPSRGVLRKKYSENLHQIYRRTPMPKCDWFLKNHTDSNRNCWNLAEMKATAKFL